MGTLKAKIKCFFFSENKEITAWIDDDPKMELLSIITSYDCVPYDTVIDGKHS